MDDRDHPLVRGRSGPQRLRRRARLAGAALCIGVALGLAGLYLWTSHVTASGRPRPLWRAALPGVEVGIDAWPAAVDQGGYVEVWYQGPGDADSVPLLRLPGAPPLAPLRELQPGEVST
jgi:hypothetical protein